MKGYEYMHSHEFDIEKVINNLRKKRKIFHSEADFQFALAWEIQHLYSDVNVRLEYAYKIENKVYHIDILLIIKEKFIPIELKYKTLKKAIELDNEVFTLKNHGAQDLGKYDFIKDIVRVESLMADDSRFVKGYTVMLTNDPSYWKGSTRKNTCCADFDIGDNKEVQGTLKWAEHTSAGTMKNREKPLVLSGNYKFNWHKYSFFDEERNGTFNYLLVESEK
jgi:hypothetical protein